MEEAIQAALEELRASKDVHLELGKRTLEGWHCPMDYLVAAALNRSLALVSGFSLLIEARHFVAAVPLVRLQLDTCLRLSAAWLVDDCNIFAMQVLAGVPVREQRDRLGKLMTDAYLVKTRAVEQPWMQSVYDHTSGYIHFSDKHFFNAMRPDKEKDRIVNIKIGSEDEFVTTEDYLEATGAFRAVTVELLRFVAGWSESKRMRESSNDNL